MEASDKKALIEHIERELYQLVELLEGTPFTTLQELIKKAHQEAERQI